MSERSKNLLLLHFIVVIFGFTGILGKLLTIPVWDIVWLRMSIAAIVIGVWMWFKGISFRLSGKSILKILGVGIITGAHWLTFFGSIHLSNVSVAVACLSSAALFTAFMEPWFYRRKIDLGEIVMGLAIILGIYLITEAAFRFRDGIIMGIVSAMLAAFFGTMNGLFVRKYRPGPIAFYEMIGGVLLVTIFYFVYGGFSADLFDLSLMNWVYILILGVVATAYAFIVSVQVMRELSPFTVALSINLEPIYSILLALVFFDDEKMSPQFYVGAGIIVGTLFVNGILKARNKRRGSVRRECEEGV